MAALGYKNVGGFDVAVDDALRMRRVQSIGDLDGQRDHGFVIQGLARNQMLQGHAVQKLHGNEGVLIVLADFVDRANVGMIQGRGGARFAAKALQSLRVLREIIGQELEGDEASKLGVLGFVDDAHAAAAQLLHDAVVRDGFTNQ